MHKLKHEIVTIKKIARDFKTFRSEDGIFLGRPARKQRVITTPPFYLNRAYAMSIDTHLKLLCE
jgi:hypothetical protein